MLAKQITDFKLEVDKIFETKSEQIDGSPTNEIVVTSNVESSVDEDEIGYVVTKPVDSLVVKNQMLNTISVMNVGFFLKYKERDLT